MGKIRKKEKIRGVKGGLVLGCKGICVLQKIFSYGRTRKAGFLRTYQSENHFNFIEIPIVYFHIALLLSIYPEYSVTQCLIINYFTFIKFYVCSLKRAFSKFMLII